MHCISTDKTEIYRCNEHRQQSADAAGGTDIASNCVRFGGYRHVRQDVVIKALNKTIQYLELDKTLLKQAKSNFDVKTNIKTNVRHNIEQLNII